MSVKVLNETAIKEFIKQDFVVIKVHGDIKTKEGLKPCKWCDKFSPVFEEVAARLVTFKFGSLKLEAPSEFKRTYMKKEKDDKSGDIPATLVFVGGKLKWKWYGYMEAAALVQFINTGNPKIEEKPFEQKIAEMPYRDLLGFSYQIAREFEVARAKLNMANNELTKREAKGATAKF